VTHIEWPGPALIVTTGSGVLVSEDGATSFTSGTGLPEGTPHGLVVSSFFAKDPVLFTAVGSAGVFRSADGGRTWSAAGLDGQSVRDLVWLGRSSSRPPTRASSAATTPARSGCPRASLAARPAIQILFPLAPDSGLEAFLANEDGILHTSDGGAHWKAVGAPEDRVLRLATFPAPDRGKMRK
jgi:photosystem II stability/assembly factor-like uncharacterized protein